MDDDRVNSALGEKKVVNLLCEQFSEYIIEPRRTREWWDFAVQENDNFYPVNIKITKMETAADNMNCKLGIYYALTGQMPDFANETRWELFFEKLKDNMTENDKDYYFLVINRNKQSDVILQGLKTLALLSPSGNNLPFQCVWNKNRDVVSRDYTEARDFVLNTLAKSVKLRANMYFQFCRFFSDYLEQE